MRIPQSFGQSLMQGLVQGNQMGNQYLNRQVQQNQFAQDIAMRQAAQQQAASQFQQNLALQKAAQQQSLSEFNQQQAFKNKLLPAQLQQLTDAHAAAVLKNDPVAAANYKNAYLATLFGQSSPSGVSTGSISSPSPTGTNTISQLTNGNPTSQSLLTQGFVSPTSLTQPDQASNMTAPVSAPVSNNGAMTSSNVAQVSPTSSTSSLTPVGQAMQNVQNGTATPMDYMKLNAAGFNIKPGQFETPQQKSQLSINQATKIAQNTKLLPQYTDQLQTLMQQMNQLDGMRDIVESPDGRAVEEGGMFGPGSTIVGAFSNNPNRGKFKNLGSGIIAALNKSFGGSHGGGKWVTNFSAGFKPGINVMPGQNAGIIESQGKSMQDEARDIYNNYISAGGNPNAFPSFNDAVNPNRYAEVTPNATVKVIDGNRYIKTGDGNWIQR